VVGQVKVKKGGRHLTTARDRSSSELKEKFHPFREKGMCNRKQRRMKVRSRSWICKEQGRGLAPSQIKFLCGREGKVQKLGEKRNESLPNLENGTGGLNTKNRLTKEKKKEDSNTKKKKGFLENLKGGREAELTRA